MMSSLTVDSRNSCTHNMSVYYKPVCTPHADKSHTNYCDNPVRIVVTNPISIVVTNLV